MKSMCIPFRRLGIFALIVERILATDVPVFMVFFVGYTCIFAVVLYASYPAEDGNELAIIEEFNAPATAFQAMIDLGIAGIKLPLDLQAAPIELSHIGVFLFFYYLSMIFLSILLLRLFMAMLSATFAQVNKEATLEWRMQFVHWVMRAELVWPDWLGPTVAGELVDGTWSYKLLKRIEPSATRWPQPAAEGERAPTSGAPSLRKPGMSTLETRDEALGDEKAPPSELSRSRPSRASLNGPRASSNGVDRVVQLKLGEKKGPGLAALLEA